MHDFKTLREGPILMNFGYICTGEGGRGALGTVTAVTVPELRSYDKTMPTSSKLHDFRSYYGFLVAIKHTYIS